MNEEQPPTPKLEEEAWRIYGAVAEWSKHAETKLSTILAFIGVAGAGLYAVAPPFDPKNFHSWDLLTWGGFVAFGAAGYLAFRGLFPDRKAPRPNDGNPVYFNHIAQFVHAEQYFAALKKVVEQDGMADRVAEQILGISRVADRKFDRAALAVRWLAAGSACTGLLALLHLAGVTP